MKRFLYLATGLLLMGSPLLGQKVDNVRLGAALPPVVNASETTTINYTGTPVVPPAFTGALDADDSTYNRGVSCVSLSGVGTAVPYDILTITNNAASTANFVVFSSLIGGGACGDANDTFSRSTTAASTRPPRSPTA